MSDLTLQATLRSDTGKGASRRLRRNADLVPAIIYGSKKDPVMLQLPHNKVIKALENEAFYSSILDIDIDGKKEKAVLKALQRHPAKRRIMHMDFLRVSASVEITMNVPIHFLNEDMAVGIKEGGIFSKLMTEVEIKCLPKDLPENFELDVAELDIDQTLYVSDIVFPDDVTWTGDAENAATTGVVSIHVPRVEVEPEEVEEEGEAVEGEEDGAEAGEGEGKAEEGSSGSEDKSK